MNRKTMFASSVVAIGLAAFLLFGNKEEASPVESPSGVSEQVAEAAENAFEPYDPTVAPTSEEEQMALEALYILQHNMTNPTNGEFSSLATHEVYEQSEGAWHVKGVFRRNQTSADYNLLLVQSNGEWIAEDAIFGWDWEAETAEYYD